MRAPPPLRPAIPTGKAPFSHPVDREHPDEGDSEYCRFHRWVADRTKLKGGACEVPIECAEFARCSANLGARFVHSVTVE